MILLFFVSFFSIHNSALAQDRLGTLKIDSTRVQFQGDQIESGRGGFSLKESWLRFQWLLNDDKNNLTSTFEIGTPDLVKNSIFFNPQTENSLTLTQAWLQYGGRFADVKAGLMPVPFGSQGLLGIEKINFPKTKWQEDFWFPTHDTGLELSSRYKEFETRILVHNGEGATNSDGRLWTTAAWIYSPNDELSYSLSAFVGNTKKESTSLSLATDSGFQFDKNDSAKIRAFSLNIAKFWAKRSWIIEYGLGDIQQIGFEKKKFGFGQIQSSWPISKQTQILGRISQTHSDFSEVTTLTRGYGLGFEFRDQLEVFSMTLFGEKREEKNSVQNDLLTVQLRLNTLR